MRNVDDDDDPSASHDADEQQLHHSANHQPAGTYRIYGRESTKMFPSSSFCFLCPFVHSPVLQVASCTAITRLGSLLLLLHFFMSFWPFAFACVCPVIHHLPTPAPFQEAFKVVWDTNPCRDLVLVVVVALSFPSFLPLSLRRFFLLLLAVASRIRSRAATARFTESLKLQEVGHLFLFPHRVCKCVSYLMHLAQRRRRWQQQSVKNLFLKKPITC